MSPRAAAKARKNESSLAERAVRVLRSREEAEAYVASVCFKHGPPRLLGVELEWLLTRRARPPHPLDATSLADALGPHAPTSLAPDSPALPLTFGSTVTVEPGGQVELASRPYERLDNLVHEVRSDAAELHARLASHDLYPGRSAADPVLPAHRVLGTPRYTAMETAFDRLGTEGRSMMCSTAAVQPCFDLGERDDLELRWTALHALGPVLIAALANSPTLHGRRTGWKSSRMAVWLALDPPRTAPPEPGQADPVAGYARRAMDAGVICRRGPGDWVTPPGVSFADWLAGAIPVAPTTEDLDLHLSTLFPPVRPHGHVEVRYVDAQVGDEWVVPVAVLAALLAERKTTEAALLACLPVAGRWLDAARVGLADPALAKAAAEVFTLAGDALPALIGPGPVRSLVSRAVLRALRGRCPGDDLADTAGIPNIDSGGNP